MADAAALAVNALLIAAAAIVVWRRPVLSLYAFVVGLALSSIGLMVGGLFTRAVST